jgi:hypothetical protein
MDDITAIFQARDDAVAGNDYAKFAATQINNISNASIDGYLASQELKTEILHIAEDTEITRVVFVKENYGKHFAFLLYHLVNTVQGWKIYDIVSSVR